MSFLAESSFVTAAATIATLLFAIFIGVQLLLAAGILPISMAWGGRQTELTPALRLASVAAAIILGVFIYVIRYRAGLAGSTPLPAAIRVAAWIVAGFMALNTLGNLASASRAEKLLFGPLTFLITITCLIVAASGAA